MSVDDDAVYDKVYTDAHSSAWLAAWADGYDADYISEFAEKAAKAARANAMASDYAAARDAEAARPAIEKAAHEAAWKEAWDAANTEAAIHADPAVAAAKIAYAGAKAAYEAVRDGIRKEAHAPAQHVGFKAVVAAHKAFDADYDDALLTAGIAERRAAGALDPIGDAVRKHFADRDAAARRAYRVAYADAEPGCIATCEGAHAEELAAVKGAFDAAGAAYTAAYTAYAAAYDAAHDPGRLGTQLRLALEGL